MKVLIVDDSKLQGKFAASIIEEAGHKCIQAYSGEEALAEYPKLRPDLVILDVALPDVPGFEVAKKFREYDKEHMSGGFVKWVPIIFLSGSFDDENIQQGIESGGDDYLFKSFSKVALQAKIFAMARIVSLQDDAIKQQALEKDKEKARSIQDFSAGVAHEIRNPLTVMINCGANILRRLNAELPKNKQVANELEVDIDKIHDYVEKRGITGFVKDIHNAAGRMTGIVNTLLMLNEQPESEAYPLKVSTLVEQAIHLVEGQKVSYQKDLKEIKLEREFDEGAPTFKCHAEELEMAFFNILNNALYAVSAVEREPVIKLKVSYDDTNIIVEMTDNGAGMTEEQVGQIFVPFYTTKDKAVGVGLGLTVAQNIVHKYDGFIEVETKPDEGSTFKVFLPVLAHAQDET